MPSVCAASSASAISMASDRMSSLSRGRPAMRCFSVTPSRNSMTRKGWSSCCPISWMVQMLGWLRGDVIGQKLQSDKAVEGAVFGLVYDAHTAATELLYDAVVRDSLADHQGQILRG